MTIQAEAVTWPAWTRRFGTADEVIAALWALAFPGRPRPEAPAAMHELQTLLSRAGGMSDAEVAARALSVWIGGQLIRHGLPPILDRPGRSPEVVRAVLAIEGAALSLVIAAHAGDTVEVDGCCLLVTEELRKVAAEILGDEVIRG